MKQILNLIKKILPEDQNQQANRKRNSVWERWDTNQIGFLKMTDVQQELLTLLNLTLTKNLEIVINKSYQDVKESFDSPSSLQQNYLEKKYFRLFLKNFTRLFEKMIIFEVMDANKDNHICLVDLVSAQKILDKWSISDEKYTTIYEISSSNQLNLNSFMAWISGLEYYNINDLP